MDATYTIQMASKLSGVGVHTIRAWEKRYKALVPDRDSSGHRSYSKPDVEKLMLLSELCLLGYTISKVASFSIEELKDLLQVLGKDQESLNSNEFNLVQEKVAEIDYAQIKMILTLGLQTLNFDVISLELSKLKGRLGPKDFALNILAPLISEVDKLKKQTSTSAHHLQALDVLIKSHMGHHLYYSASTKENSISTLVFGVDEAGENSAMIMGHLCAHHGISFQHLGKDIAYDAISLLANALRVKLLIIGDRGNSTGLMTYIEKLQSKLSHDCKILIIGQGIETKGTSLLKNVAHFEDFASAENFLEKLKESF